MRRLTRRDKLSLALVVPLFLLCYAVTLFQNLSGRLAYVYLTVYPAASAGEYPHVRSFLNARASHGSGLEVGDVLLEAGGQSLRGAGRYTFMSTVAASVPRPVPITFERAGERKQAFLDVTPLNRQREIKGLVLGL